MKYHTRLVPTTSGPLHLGHLFCALVNAQEAHSSNGTFTLRIDDTQLYWLNKYGPVLVRDLGYQYIESLGQFVGIDKVQFQSELPDIKNIVVASDYIWSLIPEAKFVHDQIPGWTPDRDMVMYPYAPRYTAEAVIWDYYAGINWVICGEDLIDRANLYSFMVDMFRLPVVMQTCIGRLRSLDHQTLSKTKGNIKLEDCLKKYSPERIIELLAYSCLIDPEGGFFVNNVKWNPTLRNEDLLK